MDPVLNRNAFFVKEFVGMFKAANEFDVLDPATQEKLLACREPGLGVVTKMLRFTDYKRMTPFHVVVTSQGRSILEVKRGVSLFVSNVSIFDGSGRRIGGFKQKFFSIGGKFEVFDADDRPVCTLQGKWTSWEFSFKAGERELARVTKKWAGLGQEMFTSADNYVLEIRPDVPPDHPARPLILAAVLVIDMVLKE
ncbi:MAG: phospholipid scramblase-related protein [Planctomycetota bacterium]|nr:phospholipid scramblase-related protein [Planctomycetota bacterium]